MNKTNLLYILILAIALVSCKTKSAIVKKDVVSDSLNLIVNKVQLAEPSFNTANITKMGMDITYNNRKVNVAASCKIIKDSAIFVSIQPMLGIELFKAEITRDSILIFDKMNRRMYAVDYKYINQKLNVMINYYNIQSLISNRFFCAGEIKIPAMELKFKKLPNNEAEILYNTDKIKQTVIVSDNNRIKKVVLGKPGSKNELITLYNEPQLLDSILFPTKINITANSTRNQIVCDFSINRVIFNSDITLSFSDKKNFTRTNIDQFLNK